MVFSETGSMNMLHKLVIVLLSFVVVLVSVKGDVQITEQPLSKIDIHSAVIDLHDGAFVQAYPKVLGINGEDVEWVTVKLKHSKSSNDDWIGVFSPARFNASTCFVENDPKQESPYICTAPIKYTFANYSNAGYAQTGKTTLKFQIINQRADYSFALFSGGLSNPKLVAYSNFISFKNPKAPLYPRLAIGKSWNEMTVTWTSGYNIDIATPFVSWGVSGQRATRSSAGTLTFHRNSMCGCRELKLTHLCFADDLLVLCYGSSDSIRVVKDSLEEFSKISGLVANLDKSTIFFSNVTNGEHRSILNIVPFKVGVFPVKYLGVPLITKRLGKDECKQLVDKVKSKVNDWKNKLLSYAGRVQLIASVLGSMQIYWASVFLLPKSTVKDIEKILKGFLWCQGDLSRGKAKIAWKTLCKPKMQGGLGFKDLGKWNEVLLTKHIWNIAAHKESLWVKWVHVVKLRGQSFWEANTEYNDSWNWRVILGLRETAKHHIEFRIGNGKNVSVWNDKWCEIGPLSQLISRRDIYDARFDSKATVADMIHDNQWIWNDVWRSKFSALTMIPVPILSETNDKVLWRDRNGLLKSFSTKQVWEDYREDHPKVNWYKLVWFSQCIPSHSFVLWMAVLRRLQTQDRLFKWNNDSDMRCSLCRQCMDSHDHLFFQCSFAANVWELITRKCYFSLKTNWSDNIEHMATMQSNSIINVVNKLIFGSMVYFIWQERNKRQFTGEKRTAQNLAAAITESVYLRLPGLKVMKTANVLKVAKDWELNFKNIQPMNNPGDQ